MDWYVDGREPASIRQLRHEVMDYLKRHAGSGQGMDEAELVVSEITGNVVRHAAGPVWVSLRWRERHPLLVVRDLGPGFDASRLEDMAHQPVEPNSMQESGRGFFLVSTFAHDLDAYARREKGMVVQTVLPVEREPSQDLDPPRAPSSALPALEEAGESGFGRESFLRALVAQVAADVGSQMELEYRLARQVVGAMSPEQMAECYVRLKHAIDGGFYPIEVTPARIVLGNTRCPFGDAVQRAPSLCRMTSSVFGGIAARNNGAPVSVALEERIAVGDPGCRVVVSLTPDAGSEQPDVHRYAPAVDA